MECNSNIIQSNSSSSTTRRYDVFVSYRGKDTRHNFVDHLFGAFQRKGIVAFRDGANLKQGDHISTELMEAIEESQVLIVVFSKNYATSSWCLQELTKIVDCMNTEVPTGQSVLPVFYDVSPSEVRNQSGDYGKAFAEHEERFKQDLGKVQRWRQALVQMASLSGWDVHNKPQFRETEKIVKRVMSILGNKFSCLPKDLVGMHSHVDELEKFLVLDSLDVQVIGIWGMGGIGKTTLARVLYHIMSHQYDASCFIDDVSKVYQDHGQLGVQKQLHRQILNEENQEVWNLSKATNLTRTILSKVKAFIVLDNVDEVEQLEGLAVNPGLLYPGSKIIVVSRDKHILEQFGVNKVYQVQCLNKDNALQLFCRKAFKCDYIMRDYEKLTYQVLAYAQGHPLAIKVLGSFLFGLDISEWASALERLRDNPKKEIMDVLRISFDRLEQTEKEIFLDIACFFNGNFNTDVKRILNCCGFHPDIGIRVLIDQSLITIKHGYIRMHDMLVELGRKIVCEKAPNEPSKWSRLWRCEDLQKVLFDKTVIEDVEAISLTHNGVKMRTVRAEVLSAMSHLRLLILMGVDFSGSLHSLSNKLEYLEWYQYPFTYLPSSFEPTKLVELVLPSSNIKTLWEGTQPLHNLRTMNLQYSKNLIRTPNFRGLPNLEKLNLEGCTKLVEVHQSIGLLRRLVNLNLKNCTSLKSLPSSIFGLSSLEVLNLFGCSKLFGNKLLEKGRHAEHSKQFDVSETAIQCQSTSSIGKRHVLPFNFFSFRSHKNLVGSLLPSLPSFSGLRELDLSFCALFRIPDAIGCLHCLESLDVGGNNFATLPSSIKELPRLTSVNLQHCKQLQYVFDDLSSTLLPVKQELVCGYSLPRFCIFNCPKLIEMKSWSIIALSWMIQVLQVFQESSIPCHTIDLIIPGTQIPRWFNNGSVGGSMLIKSFPNANDSNWIGVAVSAAFVLHEDPTTSSNVKGHPVIMCGFGNETRMHYHYFPVLIEKDLVTVELDHLFQLYVSRQEFIDFINWVTEETHKVDDIRMEVSLLLSQPGPRCTLLEEGTCGLRLEVKNCGLRWVFKQDLEQKQLSLTRTSNDLWIEPICKPIEALAQHLV